MKIAVVKQRVQSSEGIQVPRGATLEYTEFNGHRSYIANIYQYPSGMIGVSFDADYVEFNPFIFEIKEIPNNENTNSSDIHI